MPRPGDNRKRWEAQTGNTGRWKEKGIGKHLRAWGKIFDTKFSLYIRHPTEDDEEYSETGPTVSLYMAKGRVTYRLSLTQMTLHELNAAKEILDMAFANARPTVILRDRLAQEALEDGDDSFARVYREVPRIFVRGGTKLHDGEELLRGHDWVPAVDSYEATAREVLGVQSRNLPERDPGDGSSEDYPEAVDLDEGVRPLDG